MELSSGLRYQFDDHPYFVMFGVVRLMLLSSVLALAWEAFLQGHGGILKVCCADDFKARWEAFSGLVLQEFSYGPLLWLLDSGSVCSMGPYIHGI